MSAAALARRILPSRVKHALRETVRAYGTATAPARLLPDFLIIGAQKSATTSIYAYLRAHPDIAAPAKKELDFFDQHWTQGVRWYRGHFPWALQRRRNPRLLTGEASPSYIHHPQAPERAAALLPDARLVLLLRDPVDRALSHYNHERVLGREPLSFEDALAAEDGRLAGELERMAADPAHVSAAWRNHSYRTRGLYAEQLERWLAHYPRERFLILTMEEIAADTDGSFQEVLAHLGARPFTPRSFERRLVREYGGMAEETRAELEAFYRAPNERLFALIGRRLWGA
jgi:hypothetical protein